MNRFEKSLEYWTEDNKKRYEDDYEKMYDIDEKFRCHNCNTDEHISFDLCHTDDGTSYDIAYCEKCNIRVWEEDIY